jgi:hypothetical protein
MEEKYKALIDRASLDAQMRRKCGTFRRVAAGRSSSSRRRDDLYLSLTKNNHKKNGVGFSVNVRFKGVFNNARNLKLGDLIAIDYDNRPDGCIFCVRLTDDPLEGMTIYSTNADKAGADVRSAFTPEKKDLDNLFTDKKGYHCELKFYDEEKRVYIFEEISQGV